MTWNSKVWLRSTNPAFPFAMRDNGKILVKANPKALAFMVGSTYRY
jgi:hypothetical protein